MICFVKKKAIAQPAWSHYGIIAVNRQTRLEPSGLSTFTAIIFGY